MAEQTITLDGVSYALDQFSAAVQQAVGVYNTFAADLQKAQVEVIKCQSAMQTVGAQISEAVKKELAEKAVAEAPAPVEVAAEVAAPAAE